MMTMVFAVEEINRNSSLLPGVTLGYRILDSCDNVHTSLRALLSLLSHSKSLLKETQTQRQGLDKGLDNLTGAGLKRERKDKRKAAPVCIKWNITEETMHLKPQTERVASCIADSPVPAVIGLASSSPTRAVAHTLGPFSIPLVRHEPEGYIYFCFCLSCLKKHANKVIFLLSIFSLPNR